jgi:AAA+ superfamily predicted ATPase
MFLLKSYLLHNTYEIPLYGFTTPTRETPHLVEIKEKHELHLHQQYLLQHSREGTFVIDIDVFNDTFSNILEKVPSSLTWVTSTLPYLAFYRRYLHHQQYLLQHYGEGTLVIDIDVFNDTFSYLRHRHR